MVGCLQLLEILEIYLNLKTLLEISCNLIGPPGNFCVRCQRLTALVSSHKTKYQIAYLRNWSPYFIFATASCCIKCISYFCSISRQTTSVHYIGGRSKANVSSIFLKIPPGNLLEICLIKFVDTLNGDFSEKWLSNGVCLVRPTDSGVDWLKLFKSQKAHFLKHRSLYRDIPLSVLCILFVFSYVF